MKLISKLFLLKQDKIQQAITERKILERLDHPFLIKFHWAFQTVTFPQALDLHMILEFCPGGELFFHLRNMGRFSEDQAKFYFGEILLGLEYLHKNDIIYRDLKPENVLLDLDGHVRITDFGLSKDKIGKGDSRYSFCGSPEYISPEMLTGNGHTRTVDFYSLGALLYEMLTGFPPFYDKNKSVMYQRILNEELNLPNYISHSARSILLELLNKTPKKRLGASKGAEEIKSHPWCADINWLQLLSKKVIPPFRPNLRHSNFDSDYTSINLATDFIQSALNSKEKPSSALCDDPFLDFDYDDPAMESSASVPMKSIFDFTPKSTDVNQSINIISRPTSSTHFKERAASVNEVKFKTILNEEIEETETFVPSDTETLRINSPEKYASRTPILDCNRFCSSGPKKKLEIDLISRNATLARPNDFSKRVFLATNSTISARVRRNAAAVSLKKMKPKTVLSTRSSRNHLYIESSTLRENLNLKLNSITNEDLNTLSVISEHKPKIASRTKPNTIRRMRNAVN